MEFIRRNWFKLAIILVLVIGAVSFDRAYKQNVNDRRAADRIAEIRKASDEKRDYINKRKAECYEIYNKEKKNWNNAMRPAYDDRDDICRVIYKSAAYWKGTACVDLIPTSDMSSDVFRYNLRQYGLCEESAFEQDF